MSIKMMVGVFAIQARTAIRGMLLTMRLCRSADRRLCGLDL